MSNVPFQHKYMAISGTIREEKLGGQWQYRTSIGQKSFLSPNHQLQSTTKENSKR